ncbi:MAG: SDR family oxidoreductase [Caldilineaceae bacterium]|nr:SDR family oxidoreductase [Caldilineaceae bacterium]
MSSQERANERTVQELMSLQGKVAIVTGAAGWLGSAMSRALAEAGATLVVTSRDGEQAASFAASLPGSGHVGLPFHQADTDTIPGFVADVLARLGRIDILVNNAYGGTAPDIDDATAADFDKAFHTGVTAYFLLAREVVHHLRSRGAAGSIINIGSMYGVVASYPSAYEGLPVNSPPNYHALKGGIVHLTRHLAAYWAADNVRVNAICPGPFPKEKTQSDHPEFIERLEAKVPLGRMGRPEELKGLVVMLASEAGSYITGQNILVDGGWTAW